MRTVSALEYKEAVKNLLALIDEICQENNIHYFVNFGTLLGTIRHNGFIPWDDDIDISMTQEEYDKFCKLFPLGDGRYYVLSSENSKYYYNNFARVCDGNYELKLNGVARIDRLGAYVDVFVLRGVPETKEERFDFYQEIARARKAIVCALPLSYFNTLGIKGKLGMIKKKITHKNECKKGVPELKRIRDELLRKYDDNNTYYVANLFDGIDKFGDRFLFERTSFEEVERHVFEDIEVNIPKDYDKMLRTIYGNYLELPPVEKRVTQHHFTPYYKE